MARVQIERVCTLLNRVMAIRANGYDIGSSTDDKDDSISPETLARGHFCSLLEDPLFARLLFEFKPGIGLYQLPLSDKEQHSPAAGRGESLASVLRHYRLTPRDRILLSYSVARAYWQFYDSDLMRTKWSSQTIWFMPTATANDTHEMQDDKLPLQAFVGFPFHVSDEPPEDFIDDLKIPLLHRCPRIFALGILLLEIGLAKPFLTRPFKNITSQTNFDHKTAMNMLEMLRKEKWNGFSHMSHFIKAVEYCLDGGNFVQDTARLINSRTDQRKLKSSKKKEELATRRSNLYNNVVQPLAWLALKGFNGSSAGLTYITKMPHLAPSVTIPVSAPATTPQQRSVPSPDTDPSSPVTSFHSGRTVSIKNWMDNLKGISLDIDQKRHANGVTDPIRIAILDTGVNQNMPFYLDEDLGDDRKKQIETYRDFVDLESSGTKTDQFGHGSFMARLVAQATPFESRPFARIMVARVAENTKSLPKCQDNIAEVWILPFTVTAQDTRSQIARQAIRWAGKEGADIISMSFGFPQDHKGITQAIQEVAARDGGTVFLSSAGNSSYEEESFPARHPDVISIYATNPHGRFVESNSRRPNNGSAIFGTFGDNIPPEIISEFETEYRGMCQPGSSVATAVAAAIAAITMAYVAVLPKVLSSKPSGETLRMLESSCDSQQTVSTLLKALSSSPSKETLRALQRVRSSKGMTAVLRVMSQDMSEGRFFINPAQFWRSKGKDEAMYHELCARLWDVDRVL